MGLVAIIVGGCSDPAGPTGSPPSFVFSSNPAGVRGIHLWEDNIVTRLSAPGHDDSEPHSAAGSIVFRSQRDGNGEIYIADDALAAQRRLTENPWNDSEPALRPDGAVVLFVSNRSGTPRLWAMDSDGGNQRTVATGSSTFVPERAPAWRPSGTEIAFTSTRTGTSQVFVMPAAGGEAIQITHEATGAFLPSWSSDGRSLIYTTLESVSTVRMVARTGGSWRALAADTGPLSDAVCSGQWCIAVAGAPGGAEGVMVTVSRVGRAPLPIVANGYDSREPAILVR